MGNPLLNVGEIREMSGKKSLVPKAVMASPAFGGRSDLH